MEKNDEVKQEVKDIKEKIITEKMIKKALKEKNEIKAMGAIIMFAVTYIIIIAILYVLNELSWVILKFLPSDVRINIFKVIIDIENYKYFNIILSTIISFVSTLVFTKILRNKFDLVDSKSEFLQKTIIISLVIAIICICVTMNKGQKYLHSQFEGLVMHEYADYDLSQNNPELYKEYHNYNPEEMFTDAQQMRNYFVKEYDEAVDDAIVKEIKEIIINTGIGVTILILFTMLTDKKENKRE